MILSGSAVLVRGLGLSLGFFAEAGNGAPQCDDRAEHAAFEPPLGQLGEEPLDGVEPRGWLEMPDFERGARTTRLRMDISTLRSPRLSLICRSPPVRMASGVRPVPLAHGARPAGTRPWPRR
jgi:hypothetical protein